jgi:hypothetical protein
MKKYIETSIWELQQKRYLTDEDKETLKFLYDEKVRLEKNDTHKQKESIQLQSNSNL